MKYSTTGHKLSFKFFQFHTWNLRQWNCHNNYFLFLIIPNCPLKYHIRILIFFYWEGGILKILQKYCIFHILHVPWRTVYWRLRHCRWYLRCITFDLWGPRGHNSRSGVNDWSLSEDDPVSASCQYSAPLLELGHFYKKKTKHPQ